MPYRTNFEYTMARIPIIVSNDYERGKFVKENQVGFVVENIKKLLRIK